MQFKQGYSRFVILILSFAIKIAKDKNGRRCNLGEAYKTASSSKGDNIAPVLLTLFDGWVIIMKRCQIKKHSKQDFNQINLNLLFQNLQKQGYSNFECLEQNCGWLNGQYVIFDYCQ
jgi:hypothetical protein